MAKPAPIPAKPTANPAPTVSKFDAALVVVPWAKVPVTEKVNKNNAARKGVSRRSLLFHIGFLSWFNETTAKDLAPHYLTVPKTFGSENGRYGSPVPE